MRPQATLAILTLVVVAYAGRTWTRNNEWRDDLTLFESTVISSPSSAKAHYNLATGYFEEGRFDEAMTHYRQTLAILPAYTEAAFAVGRIYDLRGVDAGALHWYERALRMDWANAGTHLNTGAVRLRLGEITSAEASFVTGLQLDPNDARLLFNLALVRYMQGWPWAAQSLVERVEELETNMGGFSVASLQTAKATEQQ
jgi:Flp pilus assembly protein TadD